MRKMQFKEANEIAKRALKGTHDEIVKARAHFGILVGINWCYSCIHAEECNGKHTVTVPNEDFVTHCNFYKYEGEDDES